MAKSSKNLRRSNTLVIDILNNFAKASSYHFV